MDISLYSDVEWVAYPATNANARRVVSSTTGRRLELSNRGKKSSNGVISTGSSSEVMS